MRYLKFHVLLVQATSPFVSKQQINSAVRETHADSVITGYKKLTFVMFSSDDSSSATFLLPKSSTSRRQDFENYYVRAETYTSQYIRYSQGIDLWKMFTLN